QSTPCVAEPNDVPITLPKSLTSLATLSAPPGGLLRVWIPPAWLQMNPCCEVALEPMPATKPLLLTEKPELNGWPVSGPRSSSSNCVVAMPAQARRGKSAATRTVITQKATAAAPRRRDMDFPPECALRSDRAAFKVSCGTPAIQHQLPPKSTIALST